MIFKLWTKLLGIMLHHCISTKFAIHSLVVLSYKTKKLKKGHNVKTLKYGIYMFMYDMYIVHMHLTLHPSTTCLKCTRFKTLHLASKTPWLGFKITNLLQEKNLPQNNGIFPQSRGVVED
jgi:hypothetical protein